MSTDAVKIVIRRYKFLEDRTIGKLFIDGKMFCYTLEDALREEKIKHVTCIPAGKYKVGLKEELTPKTKTYRKSFDWFVWHIEIKNIPNFSSVYFHIGNSPKDSSGCVLLGKSLVKDANGNIVLFQSTRAFTEFYQKIYGDIRKGLNVELEIINEK